MMGNMLGTSPHAHHRHILYSRRYKPFIALVQGLVDSLSPSVISEMIAAADAASESGLLSDTDEEEAPLPDTGVFRYGSCCCVLQPGFEFFPLKRNIP